MKDHFSFLRLTSTIVATFLALFLLIAVMHPAVADKTAIIVVTSPAQVVQAINDAQDGDVVSLEFSQDNNVVLLDSPIQIDKNLTITGEDSSIRPVFDGRNQTRVLEIISPGPTTQAAMDHLGAAIKSAATLTVTNGNDAGPGSLRQAVLDANSGDTIIIDIPVLQGAADDVSTVLLRSELAIDKDLTIQAASDTLVRISAVDTRHITNYGKLTLYGLEFENGRARGETSETAFGGSIQNFNTLNATNVTWLNNQALGGGGAVANFGTFWATAITAEDNAVLDLAGVELSGDGGFMASYSLSPDQPTSVTIDGALLADNRAAFGGALFGVADSAGDTQFKITGAHIEDGFAHNGGGFYVESVNDGTAVVEIDATTARDLVAWAVGAVGVFTGLGTSADLTNVTFAENLAVQDGAAVVSALGAQIDISYGTIVDNGAAPGGDPNVSALHLFDPDDDGAVITLQATILSNDFNCDYQKLASYDQGYNIANDDSCFDDGGTSTVDPALTPAAFVEVTNTVSVPVLVPRSITPKLGITFGEAGCGTEIDQDANSNPRPVAYFYGEHCLAGAAQPPPTNLILIKVAPEDDPDNPTPFPFGFGSSPDDLVTVDINNPVPLLVPGQADYEFFEETVPGWEVESISCTFEDQELSVSTSPFPDRTVFIIFASLLYDEIECTIHNRKALPRPFEISMPVIIS